MENEVTEEKAKEFINDVIELSKKHGLSIGHEDIGGNFKIHDYDDAKIEWLKHYVI